MAKNNAHQPSMPKGKTSAATSKPIKAATQEKKPLTMTKTAGIIMALAVTVAVAALGAFFLIVRNSDMLYMAQSKDFFTTDSTFMRECMHQPGGFISWLASFLTQFFYHPALGASIMIALWLASVWLSKLAFNVRNAWMAVLAVPVVALLVSMIDTGYWLYYIKQTGYWFYGTVGYFLAMCLVLFNRSLQRGMDRVITVVLVALTYPFAGWYTLLALIYISVLSIANRPKGSPVVGKVLLPLLPLVLAGATPWLCYRLYPELRFEEAWTSGFPHFTNDSVISIPPIIPFIVMAATPLVFPFLPKQRELKGGAVWAACLTTVVILAGSCIWLNEKDFQNYNYHAEMRMYRAAEEQDWDKVLDEMGGIPGDASRQMVLLKNIALLHKGEMGSKMFKYNNMGEPPANGFDTLHIHMVQTAAPLIYYYHGKTNFTVRWCIENSVEFGYDFDNLKMLVRCALVGGEMDVARKYLNILQTSLFYKDWAERLMPITENPELIKKYHEFDKVRELRDHMGTVLDGDNGLCEMYLLNYFSNTMNKDDKLLQELTLNYAMVQKDIQLFWPRFFLYATLHKNEDMPVHYQEAAYLYGNLEPGNVNISGMPFDEKVKERYQNFQNLSQSLIQSSQYHMMVKNADGTERDSLNLRAVGEAMKSNYGDTFYWFYFFCRDIHSY